MLGYKHVSVLHKADILLVIRTGVAEKLYLSPSLERQMPFFFTTSHVPILSTTREFLLVSNYIFIIMLTLIFLIRNLSVKLPFIFLLLTVISFYIFLLLYLNQITHLLCGIRSPLLTLEYRTHSCPLPTSDELGFAVYCGTIET